MNGGSPSARPQDAIATILASMNTMNTETQQSATTMRVSAPLDYSTSVAQGQHDEQEKVEQQQQFDTSLHRTEILPLNLATSQHPTVIQVLIGYWSQSYGSGSGRIRQFKQDPVTEKSLRIRTAPDPK